MEKVTIYWDFTTYVVDNEIQMAQIDSNIKYDVEVARKYYCWSQLIIYIIFKCITSNTTQISFLLLSVRFELSKIILLSSIFVQRLVSFFADIQLHWLACTSLNGLIWNQHLFWESSGYLLVKEMMIDGLFWLPRLDYLSSPEKSLYYFSSTARVYILQDMGKYICLPYS